MTRALALACLTVLAIAAAPASASVAPGRVAFSVATKVPETNVDAGEAGPAVALPDGGAVLLAADRTFPGITAVRVRADGALEPSFGSGGIARVAVPGGAFEPQQLLRRPDGRLLAVGGRPTGGRLRFAIAGLTADGALDQSFGTGGFAVPGLLSPCGGSCNAAALAPDGSVVITGVARRTSNSGARGNYRWVVERLTPAGATDTGFGTVTVRGASADEVSGYGTVVRPSGAIVVLGGHARGTQLVGLTAAGALDPAFNGGQPANVPNDGVQMLLRASGVIDVVGYGRLARFTPGGALDATYGADGTVTFGGVRRGVGAPAMLPAPDGGTIVYQALDYTPTPTRQARVHVQRVTPSGTLGPATDLSPQFGGGQASVLARPTDSVEQDSFRGGLLLRPDGSYLAVGGLSVVRYTGEGEGFSAGFVAVAAYTPLLAPDTSFGGPQRPPAARVTLPRQRAASGARLGRVLAHVTTSGPGLVALRVRDVRGRILAAVVAPAYAAGRTSVRIPLTALGRRTLRRARNVRVRVEHVFRDVLTGRARDTTAARLR